MGPLDNMGVGGWGGGVRDWGGYKDLMRIIYRRRIYTEEKAKVVAAVLGEAIRI